mgnify:FL=1
MALKKRDLRDSIETAFKGVADLAAAGSGDQRDRVISKLAKDLSDAIDDYVKSADVIVKSVSGVQTGPSVSGSGTGTLT